MNDEFALAPKDLTEAKALSTTLSKASLLPDALRGKEADVLMTIMTGRELGLGPMQAIRAIEVIKGKPTLKAEAMVALVRARKDVCAYLMCEQSDAKIATWSTQRVGDPKPTTISWSMAQAAAAGLTSPSKNGEPSMYTKYPDIMLRWRAASMLVKLVYSDIILGLYDVDEVPHEEKDVTPTLANSPATVDGLKAELRTRRMVVSTDVTPPAASPPRPVEQPADDPALIGWGKNAHLKLSELTVEQASWYVQDAKKKAEGGDPLWVARVARYEKALAEEISRTESLPAEVA